MTGPVSGELGLSFGGARISSDATCLRVMAGVEQACLPVRRGDEMSGLVIRVGRTQVGMSCRTARIEMGRRSVRGRKVKWVDWCKRVRTGVSNELDGFRFELSLDQ